MIKVEVVLDILKLKAQGYSIRQIARKTGIDRRTVKKYLENPTLAGQKTLRMSTRPSLLDPYGQHIEHWLKEDPQHRATWIYDRLKALGFAGSYETVKRRVCGLKKQQQKIAYMRFETEPGQQAQVDFGEFQVEEPNGSITRYYLFAMILGFSRRLYAELISSCDMPTFLDCQIRAFEYFNGIPHEVLYDRMRNVFIGQLAGKTRLNSTLEAFALHYGFAPRVAPAYAAWVKGKVERPFRFVRDGFWRGYGFTGLESANRDLMKWLGQKEQRVHGTTHEVVSKRFDREHPSLKPLPPKPFDTSCRIFCKVHKDCTVRFGGNSFVVPHRLNGKQATLRVKHGRMRIFVDNELITVYQIPEGKGHLVQHKQFYQALREDRQMNQRKFQHPEQHKGRARRTNGQTKTRCELDVEVRSIETYHSILEEQT